MIWDDATVTRLKELWAAGHSAREIGKLMGCNKNQVIGKVHRLGLAQRRAPISSGVELLDLQTSHCRWPLENGKFCGKPRRDGYSYCQPHVERATAKMKRVDA